MQNKITRLLLKNSYNLNIQWIVLLLLGTLLCTEAKPHEIRVTSYCALKKKDISVLENDPPVRKISVSGKVTDLQNNTIQSATISIGDFAFCTTDTNGDFSITKNIAVVNDSVDIQVSCVGYTTCKMRLPINKTSDLSIVLHPSAITLPEAVVYSFGVCKKRDIICSDPFMMYSCPADLLSSKTGSLANSEFSKNNFTIYPNPVLKNKTVTIEAPFEGTVSICVVNNNGQVVLSQKRNITMGERIQLNIPFSFTTGIYYVRLLNESLKKSYTEKLIVL